MIKGSQRLPTESRKSFWLKKDEIDTYLKNVPRRQEDAYAEQYRDCAEFLVLTGARIGECAPFNIRDVDWTRREIKLLTLKKKKKREKTYRYLAIDSLGSRFISLLKRIKPHPQTGYCFYGKTGQPLKYPWLRTRLVMGARKAGFNWLRIHDLRHTFAMHRAIVVRDFRQLQTELGHEDPVSAQSYLDNTSRFAQEDSIFYVPDSKWLSKKKSDSSVK